MPETNNKEVPKTPSSEELFVLLAMVLKKLGGEFEFPKTEMEWAMANIERFQVEGGPHGEMVRLRYSEVFPDSSVIEKRVN